VLRLAATGGRTVVAALHTLDLASRFADRVVVLHDDPVAVLGGEVEVVDRDQGGGAGARSRPSNCSWVGQVLVRFPMCWSTLI
jgi:ABC-type multidrug transport system ATPase subunit